MLRACPTAETRARAALEFLRGSVGSESGFLFQPRNGELVLVASTRDRALPAGMLEDARSAWKEARDAAADDGKTNDVSNIRAGVLSGPSSSWQGASGEIFQRRQLGTRSGHEWIAVALVMLKLDADREPEPFRHTHVVAICEALLDAGDVMPSAPV